MKSYKDKLLKGYMDSMKEHLKENRCPHCGRKMKMQIDSITKKKSRYLWRCEYCMPKNIMMCRG